jgi:hypothetical protein
MSTIRDALKRLVLAYLCRACDTAEAALQSTRGTKQMLQVIEGPTIAAGESLSDAVDCTAGELCRITMPDGWTDAPLTFMFSTDGMFFNEMYDLEGYPVSIDPVVARAGVIIPHDIGRAIAHLKFRSGHERGPVEQEAMRRFAVAIIVPDAAPEPPLVEGLKGGRGLEGPRGDPGQVEGGHARDDDKQRA